MTERIYNFSAGPAVLPEPVLKEAQQHLFSLPGVGMSAMEISHRAAWFDGVLAQATDDIKALLNVPDNYHVLFLHGGARLQFSMIPMNFLRNSGKSAAYILTGSWGKYAMQEAVREGAVTTAWDGKADNYVRVPSAAELRVPADAAYAHYTSNETIQGVQFKSEPAVGGAPLICDASSDFLSRPLPMHKYALLYACAQKNAGPAGVTIVILRDDMLPRIHDTNLHSMLDYRVHVENNSVFNTAPVFPIYVVGLVAKWLRREIGGLETMARLNREKATLLYDVIDQSRGFYVGHARPECRSDMNVTWRFADESLQDAFLKEAKANGLSELKGHRSVGGIRASIYNAMPRAGVEKLRDVMFKFQKAHAGTAAAKHSA